MEVSVMAATLLLQSGLDPLQGLHLHHVVQISRPRYGPRWQRLLFTERTQVANLRYRRAAARDVPRVVRCSGYCDDVWGSVTVGIVHEEYER